jgi:hypothetical protein
LGAVSTLVPPEWIGTCQRANTAVYGSLTTIRRPYG